MSKKKKDNRIKLNIEEHSKDSEIELLGNTIRVTRVIDFETQEILITNYLERMFGDYDNPFPKHTKWNRYLAESALVGEVISKLTDIDLQFLIDYGESVIFDSEIYGSITNQISNWFSFRNLLNSIVNDIIKQKEMESSLGSVLSNVIMSLSSMAENGGLDNIERLVGEMAKAVENSNVSALIDEGNKK